MSKIIRYKRMTFFEGDARIGSRFVSAAGLFK